MESSCGFSLRSLRSSLRLCVKPLVILRLCVKPLVILNPFFHSLSVNRLPHSGRLFMA
jgi:hypothetical protein